MNRGDPRTWEDPPSTLLLSWFLSLHFRTPGISTFRTLFLQVSMIEKPNISYYCWQVQSSKLPSKSLKIGKKTTCPTDCWTEKAKPWIFKKSVNPPGNGTNIYPTLEPWKMIDSKVPNGMGYVSSDKGYINTESTTLPPSHVPQHPWHHKDIHWPWRQSGHHWSLPQKGSDEGDFWIWRMGSHNSDTWSITMVSFCPLRIGLFNDPFQMA